MRVSLVILFLLLCLTGFTQSGYEIIQNERTLDRPLNLHAGQFRLLGDYTVGIVTAEFDGTDKFKLVEQGLATSSNDLDFGLRYGITEYLEAELKWGFFSQTIRGPEQIIFGDINYKIARIQHLSGGIDPYFGLSYRVQPIAKMTENKTDLILQVGISLPMSKSGNQDPEYSIETILDDDFTNGSFDQLIFLDPISNGFGVMNTYYGLSVKHRLENLAFTGIWRYGFPLSSSSRTVYDATLEDDVFGYTSFDYDLQTRDERYYYFTAEYQFFPVFNVAAGVQSLSNKNGWSEVSGRRLRLDDQRLMSFVLNYEIIVTSRLWIAQMASFPLAGENAFAPIFINTSLRYNFFIK